MGHLPRADPTPAGPLPAAPIAQVAGEAAASAALSELSQEMEAARAEGRLMVSLPLDAIDAGYLVRDRLVQDEDEMQALIASLISRGQQTPIEVVALPEPKDGQTHGLISGWRRLTALRRLYKAAQEGDRVAALSAYHGMFAACIDCHAAFRERVAAVLGGDDCDAPDKSECD